MRMLLALARAHPGSSLSVVACLLLAALAEGVGLSSLIPVLGVAGRARPGAPVELGEGATPIERAVVEAVRAVGLSPTLTTLFALVIAAFLAKAALKLLANRQVGYAVAQVETSLRLDLLRSLLETSWSYYTRRPVGTFANAFVLEARRAAKAYLSGAELVSFAIQSGLYTAIAFAASWRVTLAALGFGALMVAGFGKLVRVTRRAGRKQTDLHRSLLGRLTDGLQAVKPLKAMAREELLGPLLERDTRKIQKALQREVLSKEAVTALQEPIIVMVIAAGLWAAMTLQSVQLPTLVLFAVLFGRVLLNLGRAQRDYQKMVTDESAYWALREMIDEARSEREQPGGTRAPTLERGIEVRDLTFSWREARLLDGASLRIPAGEITALVGVSGSGKTTLADLLAGLAAPDAGEIRVDGVPLGELDLRAWRRSIGYVPQEMFLLHDTVAQNVSLGDPSVGAADVEAALRQAGAWEFVSALPQGVDTPVGERGSQLSGGQRQRVSVARALVHRPRLLILDEATAALDPETERALWATLAGLRGRTTILAISHQSMLRDVADRVYRIEDGRAVEEIPAAASEAASRA
jgi:ATP-binding cassette subfamily C protein